MQLIPGWELKLSQAGIQSILYFLTYNAANSRMGIETKGSPADEVNWSPYNAANSRMGIETLST